MRSLRRAGLAALMVMCVGCTATPIATTVNTPAVASEAGPQEVLDAGLQAISTRYQLGKIWFYLQKNEGGSASFSQGDPAGLSRPLRIGSLSKSVTAIGIALLIQDGRLNLHTTLGEILPQYLTARGRQLDPSLAPIDIAHLLAHRAGLRTNGTSDAIRGLSSLRVLESLPSNAPFSDYILRSGNDHSDGTSDYRYSNLSYVLLGMVIEAVSGQSYEEFCQQRIMTPAKITGRIPTDLQRVASFSGWEITEPDVLRLWNVFDVNKPSLLSRATLESTTLSTVLPPISAGSDVYYTTAVYIRKNANNTGYVLNHNGVMDFIRGQPKVYSFAEKYVPGGSWIFVYEIPWTERGRDMRSIVSAVRSLVQGFEKEKGI